MKKGIPWEIAMQYMLRRIPMRIDTWGRGFYAIMTSENEIHIYKSTNGSTPTGIAIKSEFERARYVELPDRKSNNWVFNFHTFNLGDL